MATKQAQKTRRYNFDPLWRYLGSKIAKIDRNRRKRAFFGTLEFLKKNLSIDYLLFLAENDRTKCQLTSCENRMSGKNPVLFIYFLPRTQYGPKMALLNDPKKFCRKNVFCSESFNSQKKRNKT